MPKKPNSSKVLCGTCAAHPQFPPHQLLTAARGTLPKCLKWKLAPRSVDEYNRLMVLFPYREDLLMRQIAKEPSATLTRQLDTVRAELKILRGIDTSLSTGHAAAPPTPQG